MSAPELKPCPFCGGEAFVFRGTEACCKDEDCAGWTVNRCSIAAWNTRSDLCTPRDQHEAEVAAMVEAAARQIDGLCSDGDRDLLPDAIRALTPADASATLARMLADARAEADRAGYERGVRVAASIFGEVAQKAILALMDYDPVDGLSPRGDGKGEKG